MWVLDNGVIDDEQVCTAQLLVFNLSTNNLIHRIKIQDRISQNSKTHHGLLITPIVETEGLDCEKSKASIYLVISRVEKALIIPVSSRELDGPWPLPGFPTRARLAPRFHFHTEY